MNLIPLQRKGFETVYKTFINKQPLYRKTNKIFLQPLSKRQSAARQAYLSETIIFSFPEGINLEYSRVTSRKPGDLFITIGMMNSF